MTKACPVCELVNTDEALRCDCGYDFVERTGGRPPHRAWLARAIVVVVGFSLGVWQLPTGLRAFFVLSGRDRASDWILIITGYFLTIPAALLTIARPTLAGWVFVVAGASSSIATAMSGGDWDFIRYTLGTVGAPLVALRSLSAVLGAYRGLTRRK
jgi:hypothetical protein